MQIDPDAFGRGLQNSYGFVNGIAENARKRQQEAAQQNALSQYALNPNDPNAVNALALANPEMAIKVRGDQAALQERQAKAKIQGAEAQRENIVAGAKIIRQLKPQDQASWTQALVAAQRIGVDVSQVPQQFDPQYVQGLVATADAFEKDKPLPSAVQSYEYRQSLPEAERVGFDRFQTLTAPRIFGSAEGGFNEHDPSGLGGQPGGGQANIPSVATPQEAATLPPGSQFRLPDGRIGTVPGGAGGNTSGGFPLGSPLDPNLAPR